MSSESPVTGNTNLQKQDLSSLDISKLTPLSPEVISRQATINIGTIGHVAHGKSTVVKAISGVHTVRFKNELERNITIKLERIPYETLLALTMSPAKLREFMAKQSSGCTPINKHLNNKVIVGSLKSSNKRKFSATISPPDLKLRQTSILDFVSNSDKRFKCNNGNTIQKSSSIDGQSTLSVENISIIEHNIEKSSSINGQSTLSIENTSTNADIIKKLSSTDNGQSTLSVENISNKFLSSVNILKSINGNDVSSKESGEESCSRIEVPNGTGYHSHITNGISHINPHLINGKFPMRSLVPVLTRITDTSLPALLRSENANRDLNCSDSESNSSSTITNLQHLSTLTNGKRLFANTPQLDKNGKKANSSDEYTIERIIRINEIRAWPHFLVKWKGWTESHNTWEPLKHLKDCEPLKGFLKTKTAFYKAEINYITEQMNIAKLGISDAEAFKSIFDFDEQLLQSDLILLALLQSNGQTKSSGYNKIFKRVEDNLKLLPFYTRRIEQLEALSNFEKLINSTDKSSNLTVENLVDLEGPPAQFEYINDVIAGQGVEIPDDPPIGCECAEGCYVKTQCCGKNSGSSFAYNAKKRIRVPPGTPVFECNKRCKCGPECMNRVVQQGRKHSLCIFKTQNGCGWGVRTLRTIYEGQFICEYVGEIITYEETERRGQIYDAQGRTYLFDLDMNSCDNPYTIDAAHYGNVSHFINHSCDPNCGVWAVWINCLHLDLPKICLFALRRIEAGEELSFDYINQNANGRSAENVTNDGIEMENNTTDLNGDRIRSRSSNTMECKCQARNCRKYLF